MKTILSGLGTATAPLYATQEEAYKFFTTHCPLEPAEQDLYRRILLDGKIKGRYLGMDATIDALETDPDRLLARFLKFGAPSSRPRRSAPWPRRTSRLPNSPALSSTPAPATSVPASPPTSRKIWG